MHLNHFSTHIDSCFSLFQPGPYLDLRSTHGAYSNQSVLDPLPLDGKGVCDWQEPFHCQQWGISKANKTIYNSTIRNRISKNKRIEQGNTWVVISSFRSFALQRVDWLYSAIQKTVAFFTSISMLPVANGNPMNCGPQLKKAKMDYRLFEILHCIMQSRMQTTVRATCASTTIKHYLRGKTTEKKIKEIWKKPLEDEGCDRIASYRSVNGLINLIENNNDPCSTAMQQYICLQIEKKASYAYPFIKHITPQRRMLGCLPLEYPSILMIPDSWSLMGGERRTGGIKTDPVMSSEEMANLASNLNCKETPLEPYLEPKVSWNLAHILIGVGSFISGCFVPLLIHKYIKRLRPDTE